MIERSLDLRDVSNTYPNNFNHSYIPISKAINRFLSSQQFTELHKYQLGDHEWEALKVFKNILAVCH